MSTMTYRQLQEAKANMKIRELEKELPPLATDFLRSLGSSCSFLTVRGYAFDLRIFFRYLTAEQVDFCDKQTYEFGVEDFERLTLRHLEMYNEYLKVYVDPRYNEPDDDRAVPKLIRNENVGQARKLTAVRSFFKYMYTHGYISQNVTEKLRMPKVPEKPVIYLDKDEIARMIDAVNTGEGFSKRQQAYLEHTRIRDLAVIMLMLGTGIRESELVAMNVDDVDLEREAFIVTRKGGDQAVLYFKGSIREALSDWLDIRDTIEILPGHEDALFISTQRKRLSVRAVQELVKKYASVSVAFNKKKISPHKLRASYATNLYQNTGDIFKVSKSLGHKSVTTTKKYVSQAESSRELAENVDWV
ncbi:MAG: tyrosine-type recombinase/integrase [Clostridia bacterium]|nr:tyrosine-type recombinase/integrase [Clostridia bacterium]